MSGIIFFAIWGFVITAVTDFGISDWRFWVLQFGPIGLIVANAIKEPD